MVSNQAKALHQIRMQNIIKGLEIYANAHATSDYSIADFRIINNVTDAEMEELNKDKSNKDLLDLISQKSKLKLRVRLLNPDIKAAEVAAIRAYLELEEGQQQSTTHTYNIQFAKTATEMANIIDNGNGNNGGDDE